MNWSEQINGKEVGKIEVTIFYGAREIVTVFYRKVQIYKLNFKDKHKIRWTDIHFVLFRDIG